MTTTPMAETTPSVPSKPTSRRQQFWRWLGWISGLPYLIGTLIWLLARDQWTLTAPLFYAMPLPLLTATVLVSGECWRKIESRRRARMCYVAAVITGLIWMSGSIAFRADSPTREAISLLFWNVNRGNLGYEAIADEIRERDADVVSLVEAFGNGQNALLWQRHLPGYQVHKLGSGMMLFVRGQMLEMEPGMLAEALKYRIMRLKLNQGEFALTIVDVASDPLLSRRPAFDRIESLLDRNPDLPHLLVGDFNTPPDSVMFNKLALSYSNAFDIKGSGLRETWPVTSPVLHLDQVWGDRRIDWQSCRHGWSSRSDHRPVIVHFTLR